MKNWKKKVESLLKQWADPKSPDFDPTHDYWHIMRVRDLALKMAKASEVPDLSLELVEAIALLHELFDPKTPDQDKRLLQVMEKPLPYNFQMSVTNACRKLGFRGGFEEKELSSEGQIVDDADKIDALGAIGLARTFMYAGRKGRTLYDPNVGVMVIENEHDYYHKEDGRHAINHFYEKLLKLEERMHTEAGKVVAHKRTEEMRRFLELFYEEWDAKDVNV